MATCLEARWPKKEYPSRANLRKAIYMYGVDLGVRPCTGDARKAIYIYGVDLGVREPEKLYIYTA